MSDKPISPRITNFSWGHLEVEATNTYRDAVLYPGGSKEWDWNETGTHHVPGIQPADLKPLLENQAEVIILSRGVYKRLQVADETITFLKDRNLEYRILQTEEAIDVYNQLAQSRKVGALIHSTC